MGKYYKISPQWAEKMNMTDRAVRHPDGWYLCTMPMMASIGRKLASGSAIPTADEAAAAIGAVTLTEAEALASQRGELSEGAGALSEGAGALSEGAGAPSHSGETTGADGGATEAEEPEGEEPEPEGEASEIEGEAEASEAEEADGEEVSDGN